MTIELHTAPGVHRIIAVPNSWNELSLADLYACYALLMSDNPAFLEPAEVAWFKRLELFAYFTKMSEQEMQAWRADCIAQHGPDDGHDVFIEEIDAVLAHFTGLLEAVESEQGDATLYQVKLGLTKCPYRVISQKEVGLEWHGPADGLENLNIYELGQVFTLIENYLETRDTEQVDTLIATMWRPAKPGTQSNIDSDYEGDIRLPYNRHERTVERRAAYMRQLPELAKQLILFWVASCRQEIIAAYPNLFQKPEGEPEGERVGNDYGWGGIIMSLADNVTQIDQIAEKPWPNVFIYLSFLDDRRKTEEMRARSARAHHVEGAV